MPHKSRSLIRYWGGKPRELAQRYINQYSKPGEVVVDTFGGGGTFVKTALELDRRAIYIDLNPFAELVAHSLIEGCDLHEYKRAIQKILSRKNVPVKIKGERTCVKARKLFYVKCTCGRNVEADFITFTRVYRISSEDFSKLKGVRYKIARTVQDKGPITHDELCRLNGDISARSLSRAVKWLVRHNIVEERRLPLCAKLVGPCKCGRTEVNFQNENIWTIEGPIEPLYWYPKDELRYESGEPFLKKRDASSVDELFDDRTLALLSAIWHDICSIEAKENVKRCLNLTFMMALAQSSRMCRKSGGSWLINSYWIPRNFVIKNPYVVFERAANRFINFLKDNKVFRCGDVPDVICNRADVAFKVADSTTISLPENSLDYAIIDPPHVDDVQFFELSLLYTSWMGKKPQFEAEMIVNQRRKKTLDVYIKMLREAAKRLYYALRPGAYLTIILREREQRILEKCVRAVCDVGFNIIKNDSEEKYSVYTFQKTNQKGSRNG